LSRVFRKQYKHAVGLKVFTAVTKKNAVFWDVALCRSCVNRRLGGTYRLHLQGRKIRERGTIASRWLRPEGLHGATSQKTAFFITNTRVHTDSRLCSDRSKLVPSTCRFRYREDYTLPYVFVVVLSSLRQILEYYFKICHDRFLPHPTQLIIRNHPI
jgi:hypothetical protein